MAISTKINTTGEFAENHKISSFNPLWFKRGEVKQTGIGGDRTDIGEKPKSFAQAQEPLFGTDLCTWIVVVFWIADSAKKHRICIQAKVERGFGERIAGVVNSDRTDVCGLVKEMVFKTLGYGIENFDSLCSYFRADAIPGQNGDIFFHIVNYFTSFS